MNVKNLTVNDLVVGKLFDSTIYTILVDGEVCRYAYSSYDKTVVTLVFDDDTSIELSKQTPLASVGVSDCWVTDNNGFTRTVKFLKLQPICIEIELINNTPILT